MPRLRGAFPSPRHRLAAAMPHQPINPTPAQWLWKPAQLSMWLNDVDGDCVTAEEAFAKGCGPSGMFIPDATVQAWATANNVLNGADLITVLDLMQNAGFPQNGSTLDDGAPVSVDWTNAAVLQNAIAQGPVKIGVAADQLENLVQGYPQPLTDGWVATGFTRDTNEDHCVSLCGYGPLAWLAEQLGALFDVSQGDALYYALFTWGTIGIIEPSSLLAICGEAWLRNPTTIVK
jgi:hypothetical protein